MPASATAHAVTGLLNRQVCATCVTPTCSESVGFASKRNMRCGGCGSEPSRKSGIKLPVRLNVLSIALIHSAQLPGVGRFYRKLHSVIRTTKASKKYQKALGGSGVHVCMCTCTVQALHSGRASHEARLLRHREAAVLQPGGGDRAPDRPLLRATTGVPSRRRPPPRWRQAGTAMHRRSFGVMCKRKIPTRGDG